MNCDERLEAFRKIHKFFPRFIHFDCLGLKVVMVYDPEIVKRVYSSVELMQRPFRSFVPLEKGLLFSSYADWREPRKHLNLAFNLNVLKGFIPIFSNYSDITTREIKEKHNEDDEFDLILFIAQLTLRTVSATILNVHRIELPLFNEVYESMNTLGECLFTRISNPLFHPEFIYKLTSTYQHEKVALDFLLQYGNELIDEARRRHRKSLREENSEEKRTKINFIVDQLINHEEKYSDRDIRDQLLTLQITASDTTTNVVGACVMLLAINQDIQTRVYDEILSVFQGDDHIDYERLSELKYLEMVLKETLRLLSPIPMSMREATDDCDIGTGRVLKRGTQVFVLNYILHQRNDIWGKNWKKFDPENFGAEKSAQRDPHSFVPFGSGGRNCIGNRYAMIAAKVFLVKLLKAFRFTTKLKEEELKMKLSFTAKLSTKYLVSIHKR